jgi:alpha-methylacyl-CoA racemase
VSRPHFPTNLLGDFGGGSTYLVIGVLAALLECKASGRGQVVDAAIVDGTAHLSAMFAGMLASGFAQERRAANLLDGGAPWYDVYETADGRHMSVGPLEPQFYALLLERLGFVDAPDRDDRSQWPALREMLTSRFLERTQAEWVEVFDGTDACVAPVLPLSEAFHHPHLAARSTYVERDGVTEPAPAPRFSRTAPSLTTPPPARPGRHTVEALTAWGVADVDRLLASGAAVQAE